ncbi:hypothetical protein FA15DRAFT_711926, partial [Coprinopsis marcescibilis]
MSMSTYRSLLPYRTKVVVTGKELEVALGPDSQYKKYLRRVQDYNDNISKQLPWGVFKPAYFIDDGERTKIPEKPFFRGGNGKVLPSITDGFSMYTTSLQFVDVLAWIKHGEVQRDDVLVHERQPGWIGDNPYLDHLGDLVVALQNFQTCGLSLANLPHFGAHRDDSDASLRLAGEIAAIGKGKAALNTVKNLAHIALCVSIMMKGFMEVPENFRQVAFANVDDQTISTLEDVVSN